MKRGRIKNIVHLPPPTPSSKPRFCNLYKINKVLLSLFPIKEKEYLNTLFFNMEYSVMVIASHTNIVKCIPPAIHEPFEIILHSFGLLDP